VRTFRKLLGACALAAVLSAMLASGARAAGPTAYVLDGQSSTVIPIDLTTDTAQPPIDLGGGNPTAIAITPDGTTALVASTGPFGLEATVTPIDLATGRPGTPIPVGGGALAIAVTPDGSTALLLGVANDEGALTPIDLATDTVGSPIAFSAAVGDLALSPDGATAYITNAGFGTVTPYDLATGLPETPLAAGPQGGDTDAEAIAITPDGKTAYIVDPRPSDVAAVDLTGATPASTIKVGRGPTAVAITPDGSAAYVADTGGDTVSKIDVATNQVTQTLPQPEPTAIAITPDGTTGVVINRGNANVDTVSTIDLATGATTVIPVGGVLTALAITAPAAPTASIATPAPGQTYTVSETVATSFSCTEGANGPGLSSCTDSGGATGVNGGTGTLATDTLGTHTYTVTATSGDGKSSTTSRTYTVIAAPVVTTTPPAPPVTTSAPAPPAPTPPTPAPRAAIRPLQITGISTTRNTVVWCPGQRCHYPSARLRFGLNQPTTVRLLLRIRSHGHWKTIATTSVRGHSGANLHRIAGRWHGHLVPVGPVEILVQTGRVGHWITARTLRLTVRHVRAGPGAQAPGAPMR
jgi:YVTN family beta-propeller protein